MGTKRFKPLTPTLRYRTVSDFAGVSKKRPEKSLLTSKKSSGGRNNSGSITCRHRGGGHKRQLRRLDFRRDKPGVPAKVAALEYDPNRSARIALLHYADGEKRYILAPIGLEVGQTVISGPGSPLRAGNALPLKEVPPGTTIHNVEVLPGKGGQIARGAGTSAILAAKEGRYGHVKLPSGEVRLVPLDCLATLGQVGNPEHESLVWGKAGRARWAGRRPKVRGVAMNPVDHPMGGGEGKSSGGRHSCSPWGWPTKGFKTRGKKTSDRFIVKRRR